MRDPIQDGPPIGGFFDDVVSAAKGAYGSAKGAFSSAASFVHHPPGWFAAAMPLFTTENQRYLAGKLGGSTGTQLYDAGVNTLAKKFLGPQGPALVETYNKITEDAARGNLHAREILSHAPQIVKLATAARQGPEAFHTAIAETGSAVKVSGDWYNIEEPSYAVGGPWLDIADPDPDWGYTIGGPWVDIVGAQVNDHSRRRAWPQTRALIHSAINEVSDMANWRPAGAYVWSLDPPSASPSPHIVLEGITSIEAFASPAEALDHMRQRIQTPHVALAIFDRRSAHWPNPTNWTKSDDPAYEPVIAQHIQRAAPTRTAGSYVGGDVPWQTTIGAALDDVRARARSIANKRAGSVVGVIHTTKDGLWHALAFSDTDAADDWLGLAAQDPVAYTYAAYYDKEDFQWPHPVNEKIGGTRGGATSSRSRRAA
ncbi:MAG TPA: hypothetical protein VK571_09770 [Gemmatimonadaceae bacterium]|nr:hypothetical protein [Gemmatimonadaceae bacterium]